MLASLSGTVLAGADPATNQVARQDMCPAIQEILKSKVAQEPKIHGASLLVRAPRFGLDCAQGFGSAAPERPMTAADGFRTASVGKMFTAVAVLKLAEQGAFDLDASVAGLIHLPYGSFATLASVNGQPVGTEITVRELLNHSSGLADYVFDDPRFAEQVRQYPDFQWNAAEILREYYALGLNLQAKFKPGAGFHYTDTNFVLLALLIEKTTGKPYHEAVRQLVLDPAHMNDTYLEWYEPKRGDLFLSHAFLGDLDAAAINTSYDWGGGGWVSTLSDLDYFVRSLFDGRLYADPATLDVMVGSHPPGEAQEGLGEKGIVLDGVQFYGHAGAWGDIVLYAPSLGLSFAMTVNQFDDVGGLDVVRSIIHLVVETINSRETTLSNEQLCLPQQQGGGCADSNDCAPGLVRIAVGGYEIGAPKVCGHWGGVPSTP